MKFQIEIDMDNAAFDPNSEIELRRILINIAKQMEHISFDCDRKTLKANMCRDLNGNIVGEWKVF